MTISDATKFTMGSDVRCTDGVCGTLRRVVVDPVARSLTHLVVEPGHRERDGRLVPIELVSSSWPENELSCSLADFDQLEHAQELRFLSGARGEWGYQQEEMLSWPYFGLGVGGGSVGIGSLGRNSIPGTDMQVSSYEHIPGTTAPASAVIQVEMLKKPWRQWMRKLGRSRRSDWPGCLIGALRRCRSPICAKSRLPRRSPATRRWC